MTTSFLAESIVALTIAIALAAAASSQRRAAFSQRRAAGLDFAVTLLVLTPLLTKVGILVLSPYRSWQALPIHVCDVAGVLLTAALFARTTEVATPAILTSLLYSSIALCQPDLGHGPSDVERLLFWARHISLVVGAVYLVAGLRISLSWSGFWWWVLLIAFYVLVVSEFNYRMHTSFAYFGPMTSAPWIVEALGPWPFRLLWMVSIPIAIGALLTAASTNLTRRRG